MAFTGFLRVELTGSDVMLPDNVASIILQIVSDKFYIEIISPENKSYESLDRRINEIDLNVSSNYKASNWAYKLTRACNGQVIENGFASGPSDSINISINVFQNSNKLEVWAEKDEETARDEVTFAVKSMPASPEINAKSVLYACENERLDYWFNTSDFNEDNTIAALNDFDRAGFLFIFPGSRKCEMTGNELISSDINKNIAKGGPYSIIIEASDGALAAGKQIRIETIEINNYPLIPELKEQTVWVNDSLYLKIDASDLESKVLNFNVSIINQAEESIKLFNISSIGIINYTANDSQAGIYNVIVCVNDTGLLNLHENASLCNEDGKSKSSCKNFELTVTNENRKPNISDYGNSKTNKELNLSIDDGEEVKFNATAIDPDRTIPGIYWYLDDIEKEYMPGDINLEKAFSEFIYKGVRGEHNITAVASDGELNDSITWNIIVNSKPAQPQTGGGGGGGTACSPKWVCHDWRECQKLENSNIIDKDNFKRISDRCNFLLWKENCGFQIRECLDLNNCSSKVLMPENLQGCYYTPNPGCDDKIKNCHDGRCELLVDCGGPCLPCPSCDDGKRNQNEEGVDCGGPCSPCPEKPEVPKNWPIYLLSAIALLIAIAAIISLIRLVQIRHKYQRIKEQ
jgi:hypothetical protein